MKYKPVLSILHKSWNENKREPNHRVQTELA